MNYTPEWPSRSISQICLSDTFPYCVRHKYKSFFLITYTKRNIFEKSNKHDKRIRIAPPSPLQGFQLPQTKSAACVIYTSGWPAEYNSDWDNFFWAGLRQSPNSGRVRRYPIFSSSACRPYRYGAWQAILRWLEFCGGNIQPKQLFSLDFGWLLGWLFASTSSSTALFPLETQKRKRLDNHQITKPFHQSGWLDSNQRPHAPRRSSK